MGTVPWLWAVEVTEGAVALEQPGRGLQNNPYDPGEEGGFA